MASASGTPYSMEGGHGLSSIQVDDADQEASGGFFATDTTRLDDLKTQLDGTKDSQKLDAMKRLIGMIAKGRNVSSLFPAVVKNVVSKNVEIKKLVYVYLVRYAEEEQDLALLSISTFQKALKDPNQLIRASALRVLSSIRVPVIAPIMMLSLKECSTDMSAFVRKTAAHAIPKLYSLDPEQKDNLIEIMERLLKDKTTLVAGSAVVAFEEVCPERIDLVHKNYRKFCNLLVDVEDWGQVAIINMLTRYVRSQFANPNAEGQEMGEEKFYSSENGKSSDSDSNDEEKKKETVVKRKPYVMDPDHRLLLQSTKPLLQSRNTAVVMSVAQLYFHTAPAVEMPLVIRPLVRLLRSHREVQSIVLSNIATITTTRKGLFESYLKSFYVVSSDPTHVKMLKLEILSNLANESNVAVVLREFQTYVTSNDKEFVAATIQAIGRCASNIEEVSEACLTGLMSLVSHRDEAVVAESVVVIKTLLQMRPSEQKESIVQMAKLADRVKVPMARASILWLIGEYSDRMPKLAPDVLRKMAKSFPNEENIVKMQVLNLAAKLSLTNPKQTKLLCQYVLNMAKYDMNYDIRDRARFLRTLLVPAEKTPLSKYNKKMFLAPKPAPVLQSAFKDRDQWQMGSLSHMLNNQANGYKPLADFPEEPPDPSVRNVEVEIPWQSSSKAKSKKKQKRTKTGLDAFYDSESSEVSGSESGESQSGSGSGSESESEESGSEDSTGLQSYSEASSAAETEDSEALSSSVGESETSEEESSEKSEDSEKENKKKSKPVKPPPAKQTKGETEKKRGSAAKQQQQQQQLLDLDDFGESSSAATAVAPAASDSILQPTLSSEPETVSLANSQPLQIVTSSFSPKQSFELLHRIVGKGLAASYRFTRKGHLYSERMVDIEVTLTNNSSAPIEEIAITGKKLSSQMEIHEFSTIASLDVGESLSASLGVDFNDTTNPAKFDISTKTSKFPVQIDARVGELVRGIIMTESSFKSTQGKLTGMNESAAKITLVESACDPSAISSRVIQAADVAEVGLPSVSEDVTEIRFAGQTYSDQVAVLVTVRVANDTRESRIVVNCEKMVIGSMLVKEIKNLLVKP